MKPGVLPQTDAQALSRAGWDVEADGLFGAPEINIIPAWFQCQELAA